MYDERMQYRTFVYIKRNTNLKKKCQICGKKAQITCTDEYLKIHLFCKEHQALYHTGYYQSTPVIDLTKHKIRETKVIDAKNKIKEETDNILKDIHNGFNYSDLVKKYKVPRTAIKRMLIKENNHDAMRAIKKTSHDKAIQKQNRGECTPMQAYRIRNNLSLMDFHLLTGIPVITIRKIEGGTQGVGNKTRERLEKANIVLV